MIRIVLVLFCLVASLYTSQFSLAQSGQTEGASGSTEVSFQTSDGGQVFGSLYGTGEHAVVLAHGAVFNKESWSEQSVHLAKLGFRVLAIDFRGYGKSKPGSQENALHLDVLAAVRYLHDQGVSRVSVVGGSMGGGAAARAAVDSREGEIDRLILLAHSPIDDPQNLKGKTLFIVSEGDGSSRSVRRQYASAREPKKLVVLKGSAHAQHIYRTKQADELTKHIVDWLGEHQSWPNDAWPISSPEKEGIDPAAIDALVADMKAGKYGLLDHFLLIRHGRVVADHHFDHDYEEISAKYDPKDDMYNYDHPAWHPYYKSTNLHSLQSVTKSIASIALGIAIDEGHIPQGVQTPAMSFFKSYKTDMSDPNRRAMTLKDMLTMRSGIRWDEQISYESEENSCIQLEGSDAWIQFILDQPMREKPGTVFDYNSGVSVLLGKVVGVATGKRIDQYTNEKLFKPIGIKEFFWKTTPDNEVDTEGGLYLSAHDLARIAYLFLRNGNWNGKQIVSQQWVRASTSPVVPDVRPGNGRPDQGYGYQWWVPKHENGKTKIYSGRGYGGQFPIVVPEYDLVVVFNAWNIHGGAKQSAERAVVDRIIPAIKK